MRAVVAYQRGDSLFLHASSKTTAGIWIATAPFIRADKKGSPCVLGKAVLEALSGSSTGLPHPTRWKAVIQPLLDMANAKSWTAFARNARSTDIEVDEDQGVIRVTPCQNLGPAEGFKPMLDESVCLPIESSSETLGMILLQILENGKKGTGTYSPHGVPSTDRMSRFGD